MQLFLRKHVSQNPSNTQVSVLGMWMSFWYYLYLILKYRSSVANFTTIGFNTFPVFCLVLFKRRHFTNAIWYKCKNDILLPWEKIQALFFCQIYCIPSVQIKCQSLKHRPLNAAGWFIFLKLGVKMSWTAKWEVKTTRSDSQQLKKTPTLFY